MKQRILLIVLCAIAGSSCDPSNPDASAASENFLPLSAENSWTYDDHVVAEGIDTTEPVTVTMSGPFMFDSIAWYGVNNFCVARTTSSPLPLFCAAWGTRANQVLFNRQGPGPVRLEYEAVLDFPLWIGKSWLTKTSVDTSYVNAEGHQIVIQRVSRRTYRGRAAVVVPSGSFPSCIEVADTTYDLFKDFPAGGRFGVHEYGATRTTEWYAKDVGMVKQVVETFFGPGQTPQKTEKRTLTKYTVKGL